MPEQNELNIVLDDNGRIVDMDITKATRTAVALLSSFEARGRDGDER